MRVALDINACFTTRAGTCRYVKGLMGGFDAMPPSARPHLAPLGWEVDNLEYKQPLRWLKTVYRDVIWSNVMAPIHLRRWGVDLYHDTASLPVNCPATIPRVSTFLDASALVFPSRFRAWQRGLNPMRLRRAVAASRIIAISRFSADEAMRHLGVTADRMDVIYLGSDFANPDRPVEEAVPEWHVPSEFLLFVGSLEPVKNLALLRDVWRLAKRSGIHLPPLLIAGARWMGVHHEGEPPGDWRYLGYVSDGELLYLMKRSLALVFPSKYEGFGLPVLEAMSVGCPVVCSRSGSLPEVGGDAVWYADLDPSSFLDALMAFLRNDVRRAEMIEQGYARSKAFSWQRCASETLAVYEKVLS